MIDTVKERERLERLDLDCLNCGLPDTACDCDDPLHEAPEVPADRYLAALDVIDAQAAEIERLRYFLQEFISIDEKGQLCDAQSFGEGYTSNDLQNLLFDAKKILSEREP